MKIYKFKCKDCGSTKYEKVNETTFKCAYCGYKEEIIYEHQDHEDELQAEKERVRENERRKLEYEKYQNEIDRQHRVLTKRTLIAVICYIFGYAGIHRILERRIVTGLLYLCTFGLFGVGWVYDIIKQTVKLYRESLKLKQLEQESFILFGDDFGADYE